MSGHGMDFDRGAPEKLFDFGIRMFRRATSGDDQFVNCDDMVIRHPPARIFVFELGAQGFQNGERHRIRAVPVRFGFQSGLDLPFLPKFPCAEVAPLIGGFVVVEPLVGLPHDTTIQEKAGGGNRGVRCLQPAPGIAAIPPSRR